MKIVEDTRCSFVLRRPQPSEGSVWVLVVFYFCCSWGDGFIFEILFNEYSYLGMILKLVFHSFIVKKTELKSGKLACVAPTNQTA